MEDNDIKNIIQYNLVPKVEPNDRDFVLCGEYIDGIPTDSAPHSSGTVDNNDPLSSVVSGDNPFGIKDVKVMVKDCIHDLNNIKVDIKNEPEENICDDTTYEIDNRNFDDEETEYKVQTSDTNQISTQWIYKLTKAEILEELKKHGLPTSGSRDDCRKILRSFTQGVYDPSEWKKVEIAADKKIDSEKNLISVHWVYKLNKAEILEELTKRCLPAGNTIGDCRKILVSFLRGNYDPSAEKPQSNSENGLPASNRRTKGRKNYFDPQSNSGNGSPAFKRRTKGRKNYFDDTSSDSDQDETYNPRKQFRACVSRENPSVERRRSLGWSTKNTSSKKTLLSKNTVSSNQNESYEPEILPRTSVSRKRYPLEKITDLVHGIKTPNNNDKVEVDSVLWSCCDLNFEVFKDYNNHKKRKHFVAELDCSICENRSFPSVEEIEKHYLDVHTDSSWTSYHCLDCRLAFGVKSSFFNHKAECSESRSVCSGILNSILDFAVTRKELRTDMMINGKPVFKLSCCNNIMETFEDFNDHKLSKHNITLLTCGLCLSVKTSATQLRNHYRSHHFSKFWIKPLENHSHFEEGATSTQTLNTSKKKKKIDPVNKDSNDSVSKDSNDFVNKDSNILVNKDSNDSMNKKSNDLVNKDSDDSVDNALENSIDKDFDDSDEGGIAKRNEFACSALQDGILCQCLLCSILTNKETEAINEGGKLRNVISTQSVKSQGLYYCKSCNKHFLKERYLRIHIKNHGGEKSFPCDICGNAYTTNYSLKIHKLTKHSPNPNTKGQCSICKKEFSSKKTLRIHVRSKHFHIDKQFQCKYCDKTYSWKSARRRHYKEVHERNQEFQCGHCNSIFYFKQGLAEHIKRIHNQNENNKCDICGYVVGTKIGLYKHIKMKHSKNEFSCEVCGKTYSYKPHLKAHMLTHTGDRKFLCKTCGKSFKREMNLKQHQHSHSESRPHVCDICGLTFKLKTHVKQHMAVHGVIKNISVLFVKRLLQRKTN